MDEFTNQQLSDVQRINRCTNYYDILNVEQDSSDATIKKSYKKLALLLHPDKNKAPGAIDAFKKLGNAAAVLSDARKRNDYDSYGIRSNLESSSEGGWYRENSNVSNNMFENDFNFRFQAADISPEDFFNIFFNADLNNFTPFNQNGVFNTSQQNYYGESDEYYDDEQDEIPNHSTEHRTIDHRSLFRKVLDLVFIFVISWIVKALLRPPRRR